MPFDVAAEIEKLKAKDADNPFCLNFAKKCYFMAAQCSFLQENPSLLA